MKTEPNCKLCNGTGIYFFSDRIPETCNCKKGVPICCDTCKYVDGIRCNHKYGCETNGDYEYWELLIK